MCGAADVKLRDAGKKRPSVGVVQGRAEGRTHQHRSREWCWGGGHWYRQQPSRGRGSGFSCAIVAQASCECVRTQAPQEHQTSATRP